MSFVRRAVFFTLSLFAGAGCTDQGPDIKRYQAPRVEAAAPRPEKKVAAGAKTDRMLAVLVTEKDSTWSFRLLGPLDAVAAHEPKFLEFLKSVKFGDDPPLKWTEPEGWKQVPGPAIRFATLKTGPDPKDLEMTIVALPKTGGAILPNVNRWLGQLEQAPVTEKGLADITRPIEIDGRKGTLVDIQGQVGDKGMMPPMKKAPAIPKRTEPEKLKYDVPQGWEKVAPKNQLISDQFNIQDGKDKAEATIVVLPGGAGGELANIQRWRDQVKLPPAADVEELLMDFQKIDTGVGKAGMVDLINPKLEGANRLIGVIIPTEGSTFFLKLMGPSELVGRNKARLEAFAKSLKVVP